LAKYFVPSDDDRDAGRKIPTAAHGAIAELIKKGWVKVVVTTNFDRLSEQALDAVGAPYQVISRPEAIRAATPLAHAPGTLVKLHGDWTDLDSRNTIDELDTYPRQWRSLLQQIFNEYGLVISGWSAEWDKALVRELESTPRRYPLYWDSRSSGSDTARNLLSQHGGHVVPADGADELFTSLLASVEAVQKLAEPPLTTAVAVARLRRRRLLIRVDSTPGATDPNMRAVAAFAGMPSSVRRRVGKIDGEDSLFVVARSVRRRHACSGAPPDTAATRRVEWRHSWESG
jgi:hypothetical protein